jgi:hypothetical protein
MRKIPSGFCASFGGFTPCCTKPFGTSHISGFTAIVSLRSQQREATER